MSIDVIDLVLADLADLDELQLLDLAVKILHVATLKLENKECNDEE